QISFAPDVAQGKGKPEAALPAHHEELQRLAKLSGPEFDREYLKTMVSMHGETLQKLQSAEQKVTDKDGKSLIKDLASTVQDHKEKAQKLEKSLGTAEQQQPLQRRSSLN